MTNPAEMHERSPVLASVFISYSHENTVHRSRVTNFAKQLEDAGLQVIFDVFAEEREFHGAAPPRGWASWSTLYASTAPSIIAIASPGWFRVLNTHDRLEAGYGAAAEAGTIFERLYSKSSYNDFLCICYFDEAQDLIGLPLALNKCARFDLTNPEAIGSLVKWVRRPLTAPPPTLTDNRPNLTNDITPAVRTSPPRPVKSVKTVRAPLFVLLLVIAFLVVLLLVVAFSWDLIRRSTFVPTEFQSKATGMKMRLIPAGEFQMGSHQSKEDLVPVFEKWISPNTEFVVAPKQQVTIPRPFFMGSTEVTQEEYETIMGVNPSGFSRRGQFSEGVAGEDTKKLPVEKVSWFDAIEFCNKLSEKDGFIPYYKLADIIRENGTIQSMTVEINGGNGYRLPTDEEWEYACRAKTTTIFSSGDTIVSLNHVGWWGAQVTPKGNSRKLTNPVGQKQPNNWELFDMHGNVLEWCFTSTSGFRVARGGSFNLNPICAQSSYRFESPANSISPDLGFRVARDDSVK